MQPASARVETTSSSNACNVASNLSGRIWTRATTLIGSAIFLYDCRNDLADAALEFAVVGDGGTHRDLGGVDGGDAFRDHLGGVDEQAGGYALFKAVAAKVAHLVADLYKVGGHFEIDAAFFSDDLCLGFRFRVI